MLNHPAVLETIYNLLYTFTDLNSPDSNETNIALVKAYMHRLHLGFASKPAEREFIEWVQGHRNITSFQYNAYPYFDWQSADLWNESDKVMNGVVGAVRDLKKHIESI